MTSAPANPFAALQSACAAARARLLGEDAAPQPHDRLDRLVAAFGLSGFERDVLLLAAGIEVDKGLAPALAALDPEGRPGLGLALPLARLPGAHWSALSPDRPLRRWQLVSLGTGRPLARAEVTVDERILHHLAGLDPLDDRLSPYLARLPEPGWMPDALARLTDRAAAALQSDRPPLIEIEADDPRDARALAARAAATAGLGLWRLRATDLPAPATERRAFATLWAREVHLCGRALMIEAPGPAVTDLVAGPGAMFLHGAAGDLAGPRPRLRLRLPALGPAEQAQLWRDRLGAAGRGLNGALDAVTGHFSLGFSDVEEAAATARPQLGVGIDPAQRTLWAAARGVARPRLRDLAVEIETRGSWADIVLPEREKTALSAIAAQVRQRRKVYADWGFARPGDRGLGVSALFSGPSGSGKTLAAELLAAELDLDLFRIDLSRVVSKYIGETEKNLASVFDAAEDGGAILLFDEADALFGKRSEVRDSHDRYANMEVAYLLQRMEAYRGLAILTTNFRAALDKAFARRLRFVIEFPFPGYDERVTMWRKAFPARAALNGVDPALLGRLSVTGGAIRNIALNAAFLAVEAGQPIGMAHLARAAELECDKLDKKISSAEMRGWL
ncbi:ATP-binding protein [Paracoccaceae bacterium Fryx2]|nr:ATP-binding protein [Paracoccaceae bacterium Fryx2]